ASEIKQFTVLEEWQAEINPQRVYDQLVYSFTDHTDETMFKGVFQLPGGTYIKSAVDSLKPDHDGRIQSKKWYTVADDPFKGTFNEASIIFRSHFEKAVKEHLHADVLVGTGLSGGLDSSAIVCEVNRILRSVGDQTLQKTFSSCTIHEKYDEKKWMDVVINHTKVDASFVYPKPEDIFRLTPELIWTHDEPYQSQSAFLAWHVFRLARENGVKVLLNGQGADEYLGGYGQFTSARYADMFRKLRITTAFEDIRQYCRLKGISRSLVYRETAIHLLPLTVRKWMRYLHFSSESINNLIDHKALGLVPVHPYVVIPVKYNTVPEISEHLTFYSTLPKYLRWEDRNSMANSVEARVPFLDHRLVEFAYSLPDNYLEMNGITKRVMREALKDLLPDEIRTRKDKMGFATPEEVWVKKENTRLFRRKIEEAVEITRGIIKPEALGYFDAVVSGRIPFDYTYWRIILLSEWIKKFDIRIK
ncbi:MAG: asparagine synthetase B, partial [Bacteroidales bacterium]|nr:asparagine synthetase B [Bacteroidales bacterium]